MSNREKVLGVILVLIVSLSLSAAFLYGYYYGKPAQPQQAVENAQGDTLIEELVKKAKANPQDLSSWEALGNAYFDIGMGIRDKNPEDAKPYFAQAVEAYQKALAINPSRVHSQTDMATALFYSDQKELAEAAYKKAVEVDPNYINAHLNYGIFLHYVLNDQDGARRELIKALQLKPQTEIYQKVRDLLKEMGVVSPEGVLPDYTKDIEPVIFQNCVLCHGPGGVMAKSPLHTYPGVMKFVTPGYPEKSPLLQLMKAGHVQKQKAETINLIERWIINGAPGLK